MKQCVPKVTVKLIRITNVRGIIEKRKTMDKNAKAQQNRGAVTTLSSKLLCYQSSHFRHFDRY